MPNDAKMGLVLGVGVVIVIAVVFFHKEPTAASPLGIEPATAAVNAPRPPASESSRDRTVKGKPTQREAATSASSPADQSAPTQEAETEQP
jgi:hypothetical protein